MTQATATPAGRTTRLPDLRYSSTEDELRSAVRDLLADRSPWPSVLARTESELPNDGALWHWVVGSSHRFGRTPVGEQLANAVAQRLLGVGVQQIAAAHRARSFQATSLSTRCSPGRPRIRSEIVLRRISEVPPSMELPRARR